MPLPQFDIVFRGVREGFDESLVKDDFAKFFKLHEKQVEWIFNAYRDSREVTLKTHVDEARAEKYISILSDMGILTDKHLLDSEFWRADKSTPAHKLTAVQGKKIPESKPTIKKPFFQQSNETIIESCELHQPVEFMYGDGIRRIPFMFNGNGIDYCQIWLINIMVCILSAGLLYPWTRVRTLRYFYQNTQLDNVEFTYTSQPQGIFLVQFSLIIYLVGLGYAFFSSPVYFIAGIVLLAGLLPLYWFESAQFRWKYSSYHNAFCDYRAQLGDAYLAFLVGPLLTVLSAGLLAPFIFFRTHQFLVQSKVLDKYDFVFIAKMKNYLPLLFPLLFAEGVTIAVYYWHLVLPQLVSVLAIAGVWLFVFVRWRVFLFNLQWNSTTCKLGYFVATWDVMSYTKLLLGNFIFCVITLGLYWPWAQIRSAQYRAQHLAFYANQRFKKWLRTLQ